LQFGRFVAKRVALVIPTLFGVVTVGFLLAYMLPGNPVLVRAGLLATPEYIAEMAQKMGLDQPWYVQYSRYVGGLLHGDLGQSSSTGRPVLEDFLQRLPATLELTLASLCIAVAIGVPLGVLSAVHRNTLLDHVGRVVSVFGVAMPTFWMGLIAVHLFYYELHLAPAPLGRIAMNLEPPTTISGLYVVDSLLTGNFPTLWSSLGQLALPAMTLGLSVMAPVARMVRASMLEALEADYIRTAWAAGLPARQVIYGDALRNALIPVVTTFGLVFGFLLAGNAVVESVFAWPGIGNYAVSALLTKDSGPLQSFVLFVAFSYVLVNLAVDILYGLIDPRIRLS